MNADSIDFEKKVGVVNNGDEFNPCWCVEIDGVACIDLSDGGTREEADKYAVNMRALLRNVYLGGAWRAYETMADEARERAAAVVPHLMPRIDMSLEHQRRLYDVETVIREEIMRDDIRGGDVELCEAVVARLRRIWSPTWPAEPSP